MSLSDREERMLLSIFEAERDLAELRADAASSEMKGITFDYESCSTVYTEKAVTARELDIWNRACAILREVINS